MLVNPSETIVMPTNEVISFEHSRPVPISPPPTNLATLNRLSQLSQLSVLIETQDEGKDNAKDEGEEEQEIQVKAENHQVRGNSSYRQSAATSIYMDDDFRNVMQGVCARLILFEVVFF